ncbi:MAG: dTMP kinase [Rhodothermales bacterium]|jgi:dTMP kinase
MIISFEGIDGSGKSTQAQHLVPWLEGLGKSVMYVREPGGTDLSERIRDLLLDPSISMDPFTEMLLFSAARSELVRSRIQAAHRDGHIVICDRFFDSTVAYQGGGRQLAAPEWLQQFQRAVTGGVVPDRTYLIRVDLATATQRLAHRLGQGAGDRMERAGPGFFQRVIDTYDHLAAAEPARFLVLDGSRDIDSLQEHIRQDVLAHLSS